jgi:vancomycin permeability regulator SanA
MGEGDLFHKKPLIISTISFFTNRALWIAVNVSPQTKVYSLGHASFKQFSQPYFDELITEAAMLRSHSLIKKRQEKV